MSKGGRYDPMPEDEAAALGKALLASIRGDRLTPAQRAVIARARSAEDPQAPSPVLEHDEVIATFPRGEEAEVRVSWRAFRGSSPFLDVRRFERAPEGLRPSKQGVTIRGRELGQLMSALVQAMGKLAPPPERVMDSDRVMGPERAMGPEHVMGPERAPAPPGKTTKSKKSSGGRR